MGNKESLEVFPLNNCPFDGKPLKMFDNRLFERFPEPWDLSEIRPELVFHRKKCGQIFYSHMKNEKLLVSDLIQNDFLCVNRVVFITHGFLSSRETDWMQTLKWELLNQQDCTVATLCWGAGAQVSFDSWARFWNSYEQSAANALEVGVWLSKYVLELRKRCKYLNIYCVGHSLGAHLMGCAGRHANRLSTSIRPVVDRITGLDPAGPGFQTNINAEHRLSKSDAKFIDVIHTDGWGYGYYFGTYLPLGSVDFYPNYGFHQKQVFDVEKERVVSPRGDISKSHSRAIDFFIWSINRKNVFKTNRVLLERPDVESICYETRKSQFCLQMGYNADHYQEQINFLSDTWFLVEIDSQIPRF